MAGQRHCHIAGIDIGKTPLLGHILMAQKSLLQRPVGAHKPGFVIQITQPGSRLQRGCRQGIQTVYVDRVMRCLHQYNMNRFK